MLLKFALILGVDFVENMTFDGICPMNLPNSSAAGLSSKADRTTADMPDSADSHLSSDCLPTLMSDDGCSGGSGLMSDVWEDSLRLSSDDQTDGNICGRGFASGASVARSASSCSPSSLSAKHGQSVAGSEGRSKTKSCGTTSAYERLEDSEQRPAPTSTEVSSVNCQSRRVSGGKSEPLAASSACDRVHHEDRACSCCCHRHSSVRPFSLDDSGAGSLQSGAFAHFSITSPHAATSSAFVDYQSILQQLHGIQFDVVLGADGRRNTLAEYFPRKEFRGKLAIAITANFVNTHTLGEAQMPEISGISSIYNPTMFASLLEQTGLDLENICYYKDDTHYFVMTAKKSSLLARGVLLSDQNDTHTLLHPDNINRTELLNYARDAAKWTTSEFCLTAPQHPLNHSPLPLDLQQNFAMNHYGEPDVAMFDFTSMYAAENACRAKQIVEWSSCSLCVCSNSQPTHSTAKKKRRTGEQDEQEGGGGKCVDEQRVRRSLLLVGLVGDSLLEPFWPTGSGCGRGFLSAMDSAWMVRQWAVKNCATDQEAALSVLKEREAIYRLLAQTKSENLSQNYAAYSLNPISRYPNLNSTTVFPHECRHLLYDDVLPPAPSEAALQRKQSVAAKRARRATIASATPFSGCGIEDHVSGLYAAVSPSQVREEASAADRSLEDSFADFENNYQGLMERSCDSSSCNPQTSASSHTSSQTLINSTCSTLRSSAFNEVTLSPSASNLATLGRTRAKDIEAALRQRRQQQSSLERSADLPPAVVADSDNHSQSQSNGASQQLKSKMEWLLSHKDATTTRDATSDRAAVVAKETAAAAPFARRVRHLEAMFHANNGLHAQDDNIIDEADQRKKIMSKGSHVMTAATTLEQLLNPMHQEAKLKEKAFDYRKKTHDIKVVMKMTKETDWNKKCWEEREKRAEGKTISEHHRSNKQLGNRRVARKSLVRRRVQELVLKLYASAPASAACSSRSSHVHGRSVAPRHLLPGAALASKLSDAATRCPAAAAAAADGDQQEVTSQSSRAHAVRDIRPQSEPASLYCCFGRLFLSLTVLCCLIAFPIVFTYFSIHFGL